KQRIFTYPLSGSGGRSAPSASSTESIGGFSLIGAPSLVQGDIEDRTLDLVFLAGLTSGLDVFSILELRDSPLQVPDGLLEVLDLIVFPAAAADVLQRVGFVEAEGPVLDDVDRF